MTRIAIAEIAGRDSVAAAVAAVSERGFDTLLPTIALTGTETGDAEAPHRAVATLRALLADRCDVLEPVTLSDPALWTALNQHHAPAIRERWNVDSPCLACHLYLHLLRLPVAWANAGAPVIAGERDTHDGRIKLSQTSAGIDLAIRIMAHGGVELLEPIRGASGAQVSELVGGAWEAGAGQLGCVYSGNYLDENGVASYDEAGYSAYLREFLEPVGRVVVDAMRDRAHAESPASTPDWDALVANAMR